MFQFTSINEYHQQLQSGSTTCVEAVQYYLTQIEKSGHLNAYVNVFAEQALERAAMLDAAPFSGKLFGVVFSIKDVICYKNHSVTASSAILKDFTSLYSATAVQNLLDAGAIIIGVTGCDEFAMGSTNENSVYGPVLNAADNNRIPGGSSGGAAVAVQSGTCMVALGSDTGGSVRQPADHCGIVGLKPSYGRISRYGLIAYASSFDQIGILAHSVADVAITLNVIAGADDYDSTVSHLPVEDYTDIKNDNKLYKIAYFEEALNHPGLDGEIKNAIYGLIEKLKSEGHTVTPVKFDLLDYIVPTYYVLTTAEASSNLSRFDGIKYGYRAGDDNTDLITLYKNTRSRGFGKEVKRRIMLGTFVLSAGYYDAYFTRAQKVRNLLIRKTELIFNEFDHILLPTTVSTAPALGEQLKDPIAMYLADIYTVMANLTGIPAISLPMFKHSDNMPFGVQIMSKQFNEVSLLRLSAALLNEY